MPEESLTDNRDAMEYAAEYVLRTIHAQIGLSRREADQHAMAAARLAAFHFGQNVIRILLTNVNPYNTTRNIEA